MHKKVPDLAACSDERWLDVLRLCADLGIRDAAAGNRVRRGQELCDLFADTWRRAHAKYRVLRGTR